MDEIQQAREYGAAQRAEGEAAGFATGKAAGVVEGKAAGVVEGKAAGVVEGKAAAVLAFLSARGLPVSDEARARIETCTDVAMLDRGISRAATVSSIDEVFATRS
jgi:flagellar biosynthesis/type III secretory pathway protein FliH